MECMDIAWRNAAQDTPLWLKIHSLFIRQLEDQLVDSQKRIRIEGEYG